MKIPDDVFKNRCPYCMHGQVRAGNKDIPEGWVFQVYHIKDLSCRVITKGVEVRYAKIGERKACGETKASRRRAKKGVSGESLS